jgi:hypothetical protein
MTLPILLIGADQSFASIKVIHQGNSQIVRPTGRTSQVTLDTQQPPPFLLAGRGDDQKECKWLGICDGKDDK